MSGENKMEQATTVILETPKSITFTNVLAIFSAFVLLLLALGIWFILSMFMQSRLIITLIYTISLLSATYFFILCLKKANISLVKRYLLSFITIALCSSILVYASSYVVAFNQNLPAGLLSMVRTPPTPIIPISILIGCFYAVFRFFARKPSAN